VELCFLPTYGSVDNLSLVNFTLYSVEQAGYRFSEISLQFLRLRDIFNQGAFRATRSSALRRKSLRRQHPFHTYAGIVALDKRVQACVNDM
jgi:hypothetical protein